MSGHSKWAQIKRQKGATDVKRGQVFTKLSNAITIAVREGGGIGNPEQNFRLRLAIEKAREQNMPKENIERAIEKGKGKSADGVELQEVIYEGFGPSHIAVIAEAATDNKLRTSAEVKNIFEKHGGTLGNPGAVSYQFETTGLISVKKNGKTSDEIFLTAADAGAEDIEEAGDEVLIYTKPQDLASVRDVLRKSMAVTSAEITRKPALTVQITDKETARKVISFIERLEGLDDMQKVYTNFDITEELLQA